MIKKYFATLFLCFATFAHAAGQQKTTICVTDFGALPDNYEDVTGAVRKAIEACRESGAQVLTFPEGRYDFWPAEAVQKEYFVSNTSTEDECPSKVKTIGLLFENMNGLTIEGNGSHFMFHGRMITWAMDTCQNMKIRNVSMDFERPTMSELTFREVHADHLIIDIHPDSWYELRDGKIQFYGEGWAMKRFHSILADTIAGRYYYSSIDPILKGKATEIAPLSLRIDGDFSKVRYQPGQILTTRDPHRDQVGAFVNRSKNIELENVAMHYMHGLGIVSQFSENLTYRNVRVVPSRGRAISGFADGMHFSGCRGKVLIENCNFRGMHDDPINVHGTYLQLTEIQSPTRFKIRFMHGQTYGFDAFLKNDTVAWVTAAALQTKGTTTVKDARLISEREMIVELADPLPKGIVVGDCLENLTWTPELTVRGSRFQMTNTRGMLVSTPRKVVIEDNDFQSTGMYAILIAGDVNSWFESGAVTDVLIRNNRFSGCGFNYGENNSYSISIEPENHTIVPKHWVHRNIRIEDNTFRVPNGLVVRARSTDGLTITENRINIQHPPVEGKLRPSFSLDNCTNVTIRDNETNFDTEAAVKCDHMKKQDLRTDMPIMK